MKRIKSLLGVVALLYSFSATAQDLKAYDRTVIPPSPEASTLGKFADIPVSLYSGTPQISIPIWEVTQSGFSMPVSLSYHASGIKVDEVAPWNGLGWALNAGGVISRSVRGMADEKPDGFLNTEPIPEGYNNETKDYYLEAGRGTLDSEPDLFYFNFAGKSGKFVLDKNGEAHIVPYQKIRIKWPSRNNWEVVIEDGTKFLFEEKEILETLQYIEGSRYGDVERNVVSAWYLTKIILPNNGEEINFTYSKENEFSQYQTGVTEKRYFLLESLGGSCPGFAKPSISFTQIDFRAVHISTISWASGSIEFLPGEERRDLPKDHLLKEIIVKDLSGAPVRKFLLNYDNRDRLFLTSITEVSKDNSQVKPPYSFEYYEGLINRRSNAQDHWGYYNGAVTNSSLIPSFPVRDDEFFEGAIRGPSLTNCQRGTLNKIIYPTGGYTSFEYELHDFSIGKAPAALFNAEKGPGASLGIQYHIQELGLVTYSSAFEINDIRGGVKAFVNLGFGEENPVYFYFEIWRFDGDEPVEKIGITYDDPYDYKDRSTVHLKNGRYKIKHSITADGDYYRQFITQPYAFYVNWKQFTQENETLAGGLRIKKVTDFDPETNRSQVKSYMYQKPGTTISSGTIVNTPEYVHDYIEQVVSSNHGVGCVNGYLSVTSSSNQPLASTQGSPIGYSDITVFHGDVFSPNAEINGKTGYSYTSAESYPDVFYVTDQTGTFEKNTNESRIAYPFAPVDCKDWKRGLLKTVIDYKKDGDNYVPVKETQNEYKFFDSPSDFNYSKVDALRVGLNGSYINVDGGRSEYEIVIAPYKFTSGYSVLDKSTEIIYDQLDPTKSSTSTTHFSYSPFHLLVNEKTTTKSDGLTIKETFKYPSDFQVGFSTDASSMALFNLVNGHQLNRLVEHQSFQKKPSSPNFELLGGTLVLYKTFGVAGSLPNKIFQFRTKEPLVNYTPTEIKDSKLVFDPYNPLESDKIGYENVITYEKYDDYGNLIEVKKQDNLDLAYIWGYNQTLPIAELKGAKSNQFFYTSFEDDGTIGNAKSGKKYKIGQYTFRPPVGFAPSIKSILSYWHFDNGRWNYKKINYSGGEIVIPDENIDELLIYPSGSFVKTYTYDPLVGITSQNDENGRSTYYEYDLFNRLKLIKDNDKKILKSFKYNYKH